MLNVSDNVIQNKTIFKGRTAEETDSRKRIREEIYLMIIKTISFGKEKI